MSRGNVSALIGYAVVVRRGRIFRGCGFTFRTIFRGGVCKRRVCSGCRVVGCLFCKIGAVDARGDDEHRNARRQ